MQVGCLYPREQFIQVIALVKMLNIRRDLCCLMRQVVEYRYQIRSCVPLEGFDNEVDRIQLDSDSHSSPDVPTEGWFFKLWDLDCKWLHYLQNNTSMD